MNAGHSGSSLHCNDFVSIHATSSIILAVTIYSRRQRCPFTTATMLKIWNMKQQQAKSDAASGQTKKKKVTAAQLRVQKGTPYSMPSPAMQSSHVY